jgi:Glycosyl hydrolase family 79 C-terminal beta domain
VARRARMFVVNRCNTPDYNMRARFTGAAWLRTWPWRIGLATLLLGAIGLVAWRPSSGRASSAGSGVVVQVDPSAVQTLIPSGFLGLSMEYWTLENYAGKDPRAVNPVLVRLIRNLFPAHGGSLRIGGVTTDKTWWPVPGFARPPGVNYSLSPSRLEVAGALARATGSRLIMGINLEADSATLAGAEARAMLAYIGRRRIAAFELGNEPELFGNPNFAWYDRGGHGVTGRPTGYDLGAFTRDFTKIGAALPAQTPLAGPSSSVGGWISDLGRFVTGVPRLGLVTIHRYAFEACFGSPASPTYPTVNRLLSPLASTDQASSLAPFVSVAHAHHFGFSVDEMNSVSCGSPPGLPNTFAMALWVVDALFADAAVGVDGVNVHTWPGAIYQLFTFTHRRTGWRASVEPEYYGLLLFARAAPPGSRLLGASTSNPLVRAWATRGPDSRIRIVLINDDTVHAQSVSVNIVNALSYADPVRVAGASVQLLRAPSASASNGVTLGGQAFGSGTRTGVLAGAPHVSSLKASTGTFSLRLPAATAALLILQ